MAKQILQATVYGVQLTAVESDRYVKVFCGEFDSQDENTKGLSLMSINADPAVFDAVTIKDFPCECNLEMKVRRGGQNKMTQIVTAIEPSKTMSKTAA